MKRIGPYRPITAFAPREPAASAALEAPPPSRSLVVVEPVVNLSQTNMPQRSSAFIAQLLAAKEGVPQARERRRAEPEEAMLAYNARQAEAAAAPGQIVVARALAQ